MLSKLLNSWSGSVGAFSNASVSNFSKLMVSPSVFAISGTGLLVSANVLVERKVHNKIAVRQIFKMRL